MTKGYINRIIPFSSVDGPGNRVAIFLQGCNFNCLYCHNPETINHCINCGACVEACPSNALTIEKNKVKWNEKNCINCDNCLKTCDINSSPKAKILELNEVIQEIKKIKPFISGITVSGGECTLQIPFLIELFKEVKGLGLTTYIDTNGSIPLWEEKELISVTDMFMVDLKSFNLKEHKMLTGMSNEIVIKNIKYLASINKLYEVRTVIVPKVLDNSFNVGEISKLIVSLDSNIRYKIIKYRSMGVRIELINSYTPSDEMMNELRCIAHDNGCENIVLV
ncbi:YjjW family glycine radical enzyme activase [Clostridium sediminicola]|uniref:YjjW family glycine radical enzyme activase n=1 Tax=Clostridium sediminicola TaxID=3114879 RepID=UPI0031F216AA